MIQFGLKNFFFLVCCAVTLYLYDLPKSDFLTDGIELEFAYYFSVNSSSGQMLGHLTGIYNYTVAVRHGRNSAEMVAIIRNINYTPNRIARLTLSDIAALQLPFLINLNRSGGGLKKIVTTSKETRPSLKLKSDLLRLLIVDTGILLQQMRDTIFRKKTLQTELEQTPLGNCLADVTGEVTSSSFIIITQAERSFCDGPIQFAKTLDRRKLKISDNSTLEYRIELDRIFKEVKVASALTKMIMNAERASMKNNFGHVRMGIDILYKLEYLRAVKFKKKMNMAQFRVKNILICLVKLSLPNLKYLSLLFQVSFTKDQLLYDL